MEILHTSHIVEKQKRSWFWVWRHTILSHNHNHILYFNYPLCWCGFCCVHCLIELTTVALSTWFWIELDFKSYLNQIKLSEISVYCCISLYFVGPIIVLEYCEEGTLQDWLRKVPDLTEEIDQLYNFAEHVAKAMQHLHKVPVNNFFLNIPNVCFPHLQIYVR